MVREKIRSSQLVNALENHVLGKDEEGSQPTELSQTQVNAALGLLKKCVPDLKATEHSGEVEHKFPDQVNVNVVKPEDS